jgi:uncharacterized membrane protein YphA (DoxX/SURF4 family)
MQNKLSNLTPIVLRIMAVVIFLYFGLNQLSSPSSWVSFLPQFIGKSYMAIVFVKINGLFEVISAILILLGAYTRIVAGILSIHLLTIAITIGFTATGVRDFGLAISLLALMCSGAGVLSVDNFDYKQHHAVTGDTIQK